MSKYHDHGLYYLCIMYKPGHRQILLILLSSPCLIEVMAEALQLPEQLPLTSPQIIVIKQFLFSPALSLH